MASAGTSSAPSLEFVVESGFFTAGAPSPRIRRDRFEDSVATGILPLGVRAAPFGPFVRDDGAGRFDSEELSALFRDLATAVRLPARGPQVERLPTIGFGYVTFVRPTGVRLSGNGHV